MDIIVKKFEEITLNRNVSDEKVGETFAFNLFYWFGKYEDTGDQYARNILKQSILSVERNRKNLFPRIWNRLNETHYDLLIDLFPERL